MKGTLNQAPKALAIYTIPWQQQPQEKKHRLPSLEHVPRVEQHAKQGISG
jgi:hypothetical protein